MNDENPYRFVDVGDSSQTPLAEVDPAEYGDYVAPEEEPIYSPQEIRRLARYRSSLAESLVLAGVFIALFVLLLPPVQSSAPRPQAPAPDNLVSVKVAFAAAAGVCFLYFVFANYRLAQLLRLSKAASAILTATAMIPLLGIVSSAYLSGLAAEQLRRHGILANLWGTHKPSLPTRKAR